MAKKSGKKFGYETKAGFVSSSFETPDVPDYVVAELRYESPVAFTAAKFAAPAAETKQADSLNQTLAKFDVAEVRSHFQLKSQAIKRRIEVASVLPPEPKIEKYADKGADAEFLQSGFVQIVPKKSADVKKIAQALSKNKSIWQAYVAPRPVPAVASGSAAGSRKFRAFTRLSLFASRRRRSSRSLDACRS